MQITIEIPDDLAHAAKLTETELLQELAIILFKQERITLGRASKLAGMHQIKFQQILSDRNICIHYDIADYEADIKSLRENNWR